MNEELKFAFGGVSCLFWDCFAEKQNYKVESNGTILVEYEIKLRAKSYSRSVWLHLIPKEVGEQEIFRMIISKLKGNSLLALQNQIQSMKYLSKTSN